MDKQSVVESVDVLSVERIKSLNNLLNYQNLSQYKYTYKKLNQAENNFESGYTTDTTGKNKTQNQMQKEKLRPTLKIIFLYSFSANSLPP